MTSTETTEHLWACATSPAPSAFPIRTLAATLKPVGIYRAKRMMRAGTSPASQLLSPLCTFPEEGLGTPSFTLLGGTWS